MIGRSLCKLFTVIVNYIIIQPIFSDRRSFLLRDSHLKSTISIDR